LGRPNEKINYDVVDRIVYQKGWVPHHITKEAGANGHGAISNHLNHAHWAVFEEMWSTLRPILQSVLAHAAKIILGK